MIKILIATPAHGEIFFTPYVVSMLRLQRVIDRNKWSSTLATISYADVNESRNFLITHWFDKTDASHLLSVDTDMGFDPQLIVDMINFDRPVVGVIYPKRQIDLKRLAALAAKGTPAGRAIAQAHDFIFKRKKDAAGDRVQNGFLEATAAGPASC